MQLFMGGEREGFYYHNKMSRQSRGDIRAKCPAPGGLYAVTTGLLFSRHAPIHPATAADPILVLGIHNPTAKIATELCLTQQFPKAYFKEHLLQTPHKHGELLAQQEGGGVGKARGTRELADPRHSSSSPRCLLVAAHSSNPWPSLTLAPRGSHIRGTHRKQQLPLEFPL